MGAAKHFDSRDERDDAANPHHRPEEEGEDYSPVLSNRQHDSSEAAEGPPRKDSDVVMPSSEDEEGRDLAR